MKIVSIILVLASFSMIIVLQSKQSSSFPITNDKVISNSTPINAESTNKVEIVNDVKENPVEPKKFKVYKVTIEIETSREENPNFIKEKISSISKLAESLPSIKRFETESIKGVKGVLSFDVNK